MHLDFATEHVSRAPRLCYRACATELMETRASVRTRIETSIKHSMTAAEKSLSLGVLLSSACDGCRHPVVVVVVAWLRMACLSSLPMACLPWLPMIAAFASYAFLALAFYGLLALASYGLLALASYGRRLGFLWLA